MKLHEALATGKPYRREGWTCFLKKDSTPKFERHEVLADDWEVEELSTILTKTQFKEALLKAQTKTQEDDTVIRWMNTSSNDRYWEKVISRLTNELFKEDT